MAEPKNVVIFLPLAKESVDRDFFESFNIAKSVLIANMDKLPFQLGAVIDYYCHTFPIDANRNECAWRAIDGIKTKNGSIFKPDITIWLDTDQTFPSNTLFNLLKHNLPIVAGIYYLKAKTKDVPFYPVMFKKGSDYKKRRLYKPIVEWPRDELFEVDFLGMGCVQIWTEILEKMKPKSTEVKRLKKDLMDSRDAFISLQIARNTDEIIVDQLKSQWNDFIMDTMEGCIDFFRYQRHPKDAPDKSAEWKHKYGIKDVSEDSWFWRKVRETGNKIMVDPEVECGHIGKMIFTGDMYRGYVNEHEKQYRKVHGDAKYEEEWAKVCKVEKNKDSAA